MDLLIDVLDFITSIFGESVAGFFDKRIKSKKIKAFLSLLAILIGVSCVVGIVLLVVLIFANLT